MNPSSDAKRLGDQDAKQRLVGILAADASGYSRLMAANERATMADLDTARLIFRKHIEANHGRVIDTAGDSVLAIFDTATGAVSAAAATQEELAATFASSPEDRLMRFRIGVHLGDVMEKPDGTVYGGGVNIAARLQSLASVGGIVVSDVVYSSVRGRVEGSFVDMGEQELKNIDRAVRAFRLETSDQRAAELPLPDKPSIAVLPFTNMSGDSEQTYFADGMTEDIITLLSCVPDLFVIARNSTFAYKGQSPDVRKVGRELGVRYVVEGSVRKAGERIRVTAQLIDATSGSHIWADRYDRNLTDIFDVQDELGQGIVGAMQSRLLIAEARFVSKKPPGALDAWGNLVQAKVKLSAYRRSDIDEAEPFARRAVKIDPAYGEAHAVLGHILAWRSFNGWTDDWYRAAKDAATHCERALALAPSDPAVLTDIGFAYWWLGRFLKCLTTLERAAVLNPNAAMTCAVLGTASAVCGKPEAGAEYARRAFRLSPKDPLEYMFLIFFCWCEFFEGRYAEALDAADRALQTHPSMVPAHLNRAACCVRLGRIGEAKASLARIEKLGSEWAIDSLFLPRTEGTLWGQYTGAIREAMDREPRAK